MADNNTPEDIYTSPSARLARLNKNIRPSWVPPDASVPGTPAYTARHETYPPGHPMHKGAAPYQAPQPVARPPDPDFESIRQKYATPKLPKPPR